MQQALDIYQVEFDHKLDALLHAKLGLRSVAETDGALFQTMFALMQANHVDFTLFFRYLGALQVNAPEAFSHVAAAGHGESPAHSLTSTHAAPCAS